MPDSNEANTECPKCSGRGKYADPARALVQVTCERCEGSGTVPEGSQQDDDQPAAEPRKVPFGQSPRKQ